MKAHYRISEDDCVQAMRLHGKMTFRRLMCEALIVGALLVLSFFASQQVRYLLFCGLAGALLFSALVFYVIVPWQVRRHYRKYKAIQAELTVQLCEDGVRFASPDGEGIITWQNILKWRHNDRYLLIYLAPRLYNLVPKSITAQGFELPALIDALTQHVGRPV